MHKHLGKHWHCLPATEVLDLLETDRDQGVHSFEVIRRPQPFGPKILTRKRGKSPLVLFLLQIHQPLVYILLGATVIAAFMQEWADASMIFGVIMLNSEIGFVQESRAVKTMQALARNMDSEANQ